MNLDQNQQNSKGVSINVEICESGDPHTKPRNSAPRSVWFIFLYLISRITFVIILGVNYYVSPHDFNSQTILALASFISTFIKLILPAILIVLLYRRRYSFLKATVIFAVLDGIALLQLIQPVFSADVNQESLSALSYVSIFFHVMSIILAIYSNNSKRIQAHCNCTPNSDRKKLLDNSHSTTAEDTKKLFSIRGWLGLFAFFLIFLIVATIGILTWFWMQMHANSGEVNFGSDLSTAIVLGVMFYIFPLISLIRLFYKRLDFRNSYVTGTTIDIIMFLIILVVPDGKMLLPFVPYMLIGVILMIVWGFYLFHSKRVILSCPNGKPDKGARIDGQKWRKLY